MNTLPLDVTDYVRRTGTGASNGPIFTGTPLTVAYTYDDENRLTGENTVNASDATIFSQSYVLNADGTRASVTESELQPDGSTATIHTAWTYDSEDRLIGESIDSSLAGQSESETWTYDLDGNRITQLVIANDDTDTTTSTYNSDGELTQTVDTASGTTTYAYDNDGNEITVTNGSNVTSYAYNLQGQLSSVTVNGSTTTYTYDTGGNRSSETTGGTTTYYLNDPNNPTGYAKPVEQWVSSDGNRSDATLGMSYMIGLSVVGQADAEGNISYFIADGGGSTRQMMDTTGAVIATFNYDAFGDAIGFDPSTAGTIFLFGGDGMYDAASGLYFHGSGRQSDNANDDFIEMDAPGYGSNADPLSLNLYALDGADPIGIRDPSGHGLLDILAAMGGDSILASIEGVTGQALRNQVIYGVKAGLAVTALEDLSTIASFGIGYLAGQIIGEVVSYAAGRLAPIIGDLVSGLTQDVVKVFRVEGAGNARIIIDEAGNVAIQNTEKTLFLNFGSRERAVAFLQKRLSQGFADTVIKSFDVPKSFLNDIRAAAVPESMAGQYPNAPIRVDITKAPDQYGLRPDQIQKLVSVILPGSGNVSTQ